MFASDAVLLAGCLGSFGRTKHLDRFADSSIFRANKGPETRILVLNGVAFDAPQHLVECPQSIHTSAVTFEHDATDGNDLADTCSFQNGYFYTPNTSCLKRKALWYG